MTPPPVYFVDAFADRPFTGNPAAVCLLDAPAPAAWMQSLAAEINLSETSLRGGPVPPPSRLTLPRPTYTIFRHCFRAFSPLPAAAPTQCARNRQS
jgi:hypothetical protein